MKKFVLFLVVVFLATSLIGCSKKKDESAYMEGLNGVVSENVVSVTESAQTGAVEAVPVMVENGEAAVQSSFEMPVAAEAVVGKPSAKQIQQALKSAGMYNGKVDGEIGPKTKKAIEAFQAQNGLKADGKVGVKTWKALSAYLNKPAEVINPTTDVQSVE